MKINWSATHKGTVTIKWNRLRGADLHTKSAHCCSSWLPSNKEKDTSGSCSLEVEEKRENWQFGQFANLCASWTDDGWYKEIIKI